MEYVVTMGYATEEIGTILEAVASSHVTPASGSVIAIVGGFGTALVEMGAIQSDPSSEQQNSHEEGHQSIETTLYHQRNVLLDLAEADSRTVDSIHTTNEAPSQTAVERGTGIPLTIARSCTTVLEVTSDDVLPVSERVRPDLIAGLAIVRTAGIRALHIVDVNLDTIDNRQVREELGSQATAIRETLRNTTKRLEANLETELNQ